MFQITFLTSDWIFHACSDTECLAIEVNLRKTKWLLICSYNAHKNNISSHLKNISKIIDRNSSRYGKYLCLGDFNSETLRDCTKKFLWYVQTEEVRYRFISNKLFKKFSRFTGNWSWCFRFSQNESNSLENVFY